MQDIVQNYKKRPFSVYFFLWSVSILGVKFAGMSKDTCVSFPVRGNDESRRRHK